jgi:4-amino-4-deoxy-L-arabinose transferase-like glycosyltransferase
LAPGSEQALLIAVLVVALAVRLTGLNFESFSMDEVTDLQIARLPLQQIVPLADGFPPLFHLLLKGWLMVWETPLAVRWLPALLGLVTVYAVYRLALATAGRPAAIVASMLTAISPVHVWFAQESRAYALALPLAALALWRFRHAHDTNTRRDWLIYAGVALAAMCTHYFLAIVVILQALWFLPRLLRPGRDRRPALTAYGCLALSALPVLLLLRSDLAFQSGAGEGGIGLGDLLYTPYVFLLGFSTGPSLRELHEIGLREAAVAFLPWIAALAACLLPLGISWLRRSRPSFEGLGYLLVTCLGPVAVTVVLSALFGLKYKVSYVAWASIPLLVILGDAIAKSWDRWSTRVGVAGYLCLASVALGNRHLVDRYRNEDVRSLATYLEAHSSRETPIFVVVGYMAEPLVFYLGPGWSVNALPNGPATLRTIAELTGGTAARPAWIVYTRPFHGDPSGEIRARLATGSTTRLSATFAGVDLYRLEPAEKDRAPS